MDSKSKTRLKTYLVIYILYRAFRISYGSNLENLTNPNARHFPMTPRRDSINSISLSHSEGPCRLLIVQCTICTDVRVKSISRLAYNSKLGSITISNSFINIEIFDRLIDLSINIYITGGVATYIISSR